MFRLEPAGSGSKVLVHTNLTLSGAVAQYGRGVGIIQATAAQLMNQFAKNLKERIAPEGPPRSRRAGRQLRPQRRRHRHRRQAAGRKADLGLRADGAGDLDLDHRPIQAFVGWVERLRETQHFGP